MNSFERKTEKNFSRSINETNVSMEEKKLEPLRNR